MTIRRDLYLCYSLTDRRRFRALTAMLARSCFAAPRISNECCPAAPEEHLRDRSLGDILFFRDLRAVSLCPSWLNLLMPAFYRALPEDGLK